ncbi:huntingtin-interacting protein 1 isoform X2 [Spodoptera litura]|uniref:Huntingtin-interacting protein 1 isoform X2 n=1 Tax=Spodoptera litura TaxID=69820 RepID=A0A9J7ESL2_SPOLT|nr:huntingtin-interacting protein 1 isoform X2 [Spodoptera litura]XP_022837803.1 huntingtin-interacting protein 1 isoform X2 [Spodoptera litura]XP_022837804.1 huntingtin-interacting protein 1 isoform X2 [Spodoptera litura]
MANPNDKRFYQLTLAIQKAINANETPVKEKHVRSTLIGTFKEQSAVTYWMVAIRLPLQENRIVAWKFCHVTHKLLREGHPACLDDSQRHIGMIENLGKLWVHLREGYGKLVHLYCNLLVCKLKFHARNPRFPGNMQLTAEELDAIAENDVNNYFQLCVELFDYMDEILNLQAAVFDSLGNARANSMTASGQCRLAALIPCAQDASQLYDCNVRLLFRLHASLPADTLAGHRERFRQQFKKLSSFYKHASSLQYYRNLLTLPVLPSNPPNFLQQSDFGTYVTPVVTIPEPPPDEVDSVGSLIDTSDTMSQATMDNLEDFDRPSPSPQPDPIVERDRLIDHLQNELKRMRSEVSQLVQERNTMIGSMREHCSRIESQLHNAKVELEEEKHKAEILAVQTPEIKQKLTETEEKAKVTDEKFQKLKGAYTQLREEHITLIRQKAEVDKLSASLRAAAAQHESARLALQQQLNDRNKDVELLQQSASSSEEIEAYKSEILSLRTELEQSRQKELELETLKASMEALEIEHNTATKEQEEKLTTVTNELKETTETLEKIKQEKEEREVELSKVKEELVGLRESSGEEYKKVVEEKEAALKQVAELQQQHLQEKEEIRELNNECEKLRLEMATKSLEFDNSISEKESKIKESLDQLEELRVELENSKTDYESKINDSATEMSKLQERIDELVQYQVSAETLKAELAKDGNELSIKVKELLQEKEKLQSSLQEQLTEISNLESKLKDLEETKNQEVTGLKEEIQKTIDEKNTEINRLQTMLDEKSEFGQRQLSETENLSKNILELETTIRDTNIQLQEQKAAYENQLKDCNCEITILKEKLQTVTESKDEIIGNLKGMVAEKDGQVIALNVEVTQLADENTRLKDELNETQAELEIGRNEFLTLREEHENIVNMNENNLTIKNLELRDLHEKINELTAQKAEVEQEKEKISNEMNLEKEVLESKILELTVAHDNLIKAHEEEKSEKEAQVTELNNEISNLKSEFEQFKDEKENEIQSLNDKIGSQEASFNEQVALKDATIAEAEANIQKLKDEFEELQQQKLKEKEDMDNVMSERERERQLLETRLGHAESKRLNAECELQDLLQHNTVLEADLAAVKRQLEEAQKALQNQTTRLVTCAGEVALEVANGALESFENGHASDTVTAAADLAAKALDELARHTEVSGNEESVLKSAMFAAHNTAQLSAYVADVTNVSTDIALAEKLNNECRSMLMATKECLESIKGGSIVGSHCSDARSRVRSLMTSAAAADRLNSGARSVDDELADMDRAIEEAASQIENMLAATRAGTSGVKLEVNGKILDACTTLMGAVKILVQDARHLQNELGDPKTRQKMYRKNPQWSEGLISAAKAVVFAAKLLVTSADEAVGAAGQVEGVSAAAHEVAGSTAQLVAASRARAAPASPALARLTAASRAVAAATGALVAAVKSGSALVLEQEALDTSSLSLTATRRLEMESKVRSLKLETALDAERARLAALRKRHYQLAQLEENGNVENGKD